MPEKSTILLSTLWGRIRVARVNCIEFREEISTEVNRETVQILLEMLQSGRANNRTGDKPATTKKSDRHCRR